MFMPEATLMTSTKNTKNQKESSETIAQIVSTYGKHILIGFIVVILAILVVYNFTFRQTINAENDYISAQVNFNQFEANGNDSLESLAELESLLVSHMDLQAKYDALIAQNLLIRNEVELAIPYAERTFHRTQEETHSLYDNYAKATLLISQQAHSEALILTQQIDSDLKLAGATNTEKQRTLFLYNLLRLALLFETLGDINDKETAWSALQEALASPENKNASLRISEVFKEGRLSLSDLIEAKLSSFKSLH